MLALINSYNWTTYSFIQAIPIVPLQVHERNEANILRAKSDAWSSMITETERGGLWWWIDHVWTPSVPSLLIGD